MSKDTLFNHGVAILERIKPPLFRKRLLRLFLITILLTVSFIFIPKSFAQSNMIQCYFWTGQGCDYDLSIDPEPWNDCAPGFREPVSCEGSPRLCCQLQNPEATLETCHDVPCEPIAPPEFPPECSSQNICTNDNAGVCQTAGGTPVDCTMRSGGRGICCRPPEDPNTPIPCSGNEECISTSRNACDSRMGEFGVLCPIGPGSTGNCCAPRTTPAPGYPYCDDGFACTNVSWPSECTTGLGGSYVPCSTRSLEQGNCCVLGEEPEPVPEGSGYRRSPIEPICQACVDVLNQNPNDTFNCIPPQYDTFADCCDSYQEAENCEEIPDGDTYGYYLSSSGTCRSCYFATGATLTTYCNPAPYTNLQHCCGQNPGASGCQGDYTPYDPYADQDLPNRWQELADRYGVDSFEISATVYDILYPIGLAIGLFAIISAGYSFMTSQGQPDRVKEAKEKLTAAIVGILFVILSIVILRIIIRTLLDTTFTM